MTAIWYKKTTIASLVLLGWLTITTSCKPDKRYDADKAIATDSSFNETGTKDTTPQQYGPKPAPFYKTLKNGIRQHVHAYHPNNPYPNIGDVLHLNMDYYINDSLLFSSVEVPGTFKMMLNKPKYQGSINYGLLQMHEKDSAEFIVEASGFFTYTKELINIPDFVSPGDSIRFFVKIIDIVPNTEFQTTQEKKIADARQQENSNIKKYMLEHDIEATNIGDRIYREIHSQGKVQEIDEDSRVTIHYIGLFLNDSPFSDTKKEGKPFTFDMGKSIVIPGLEKGLSGVKENSKLTLIIPFEQAYGPYQEGPIPPYSTLVFKIEVLKVSNKNS
ncbi:MAG: FKBP-type peptidyl-prolyl cis-trans isomerase [Bacteroidota bacterium]|nr:FKBP-type peptidyl-prolyl cis-trans isomerase [Bacteroidota bacterium]